VPDGYSCGYFDTLGWQRACLLGSGCTVKLYWRRELATKRSFIIKTRSEGW